MQIVTTYNFHFCYFFLFPILLYCTGYYSCRGQVQGQEWFDQKPQDFYEVYDHPEISIRPLNLTVSKGGSRANFTCRITNENDLKDPIDQVSFVWMVNNKTVSASKK